MWSAQSFFLVAGVVVRLDSSASPHSRVRCPVLAPNGITPWIAAVHYELFYELSERVTIRWGATETLVHFLMSPKPDPKIRGRFLSYLHRVFRKGLGDSSTAFDKAMGEKIESLQPKFQRWLQVRQ